MELIPERGRHYRIELCSGELRRWEFLGEAGGCARWRDLDSGTEFSEAQLMYAWHILDEIR